MEEGGGGGLASGACVPEAPRSRMEEEGEMEEEEGEGGAPMRMERNEERKKLQHFKSASLSFALLIHSPG